MNEHTLKDLALKLERVKQELDILYEISNALRSTLKLDEILYIILTAVTSHEGLEFNRAMLFLIDESGNFLEGKKAMGPESVEDANKIWKDIESKKMTLEDLIAVYKFSKEKYEHTTLNRLVNSIKIPVKDSASVLTIAIADGMPLQIKINELDKKIDEDFIKKLRLEDFVVVPLKTHDKVLGIIIADNLFTKKPITKEDLRMLAMLATHAGFAIENSRLYEESLIQADTDSLTKLWNHGFFHRILDEKIQRAKKNKSTLGLLLIDMDDFKHYNDKLGHQKGDALLKEVALILRSASRKGDYVCRYGGEEFAIISPDATTENALVLAERVKGRIEKTEFYEAQIQPLKKVTVSIGVAVFPEDAVEKDKLIYKADMALYDAKHQGKNRLKLAE
jgi:diguanylate cyclase (GGDEF)-like protein